MVSVLSTIGSGQSGIVTVLLVSPGLNVTGRVTIVKSRDYALKAGSILSQKLMEQYRGLERPCAEADPPCP